ncbi:DUF485 domain-containing protein [Streptomyces sp. 891-h]|uniref:DUF485 domain-containing protein n=1 Tax=unclassified Streptomyces TaxID=2593676 RepID=UPI001FA9F73B|nr:DUF485 domain-containing protein [Streptomyces sp. 891-h]UNZ16987.1 DUF485 domain-containing protein [Streptomyces sp. 891-h]
MCIDDPWHDVLATGGHESGGAPLAALPRQRAPMPRGEHGLPSVEHGLRADDRGPAPGELDVYPAVQRSAAFQQLRRRHRRFVLPVGAAFLLSYLGFILLTVAAPGLMARPVAGVLNAGMAAGLAQFAAVFLLTWLYARHARLRRDRLALELRWETQEMTRGAASLVAVASAASAASGKGGPR